MFGHCTSLYMYLILLNGSITFQGIVLKFGDHIMIGEMNQMQTTLSLQTISRESEYIEIDSMVIHHAQNCRIHNLSKFGESLRTFCVGWIKNSRGKNLKR